MSDWGKPMTTLDNMILGAVSGVLIGIWPLVKGVKGDQVALGVSGFFASAICGAVLGLLLALPIAWLFAWLVKQKLDREATSSTAGSQGDS
jgi:hypothetical protein